MEWCVAHETFREEPCPTARLPLPAPPEQGAIHIHVGADLPPASKTERAPVLQYCTTAQMCCSNKSALWPAGGTLQRVRLWRARVAWRGEVWPRGAEAVHLELQPPGDAAGRGPVTGGEY